MNDPCCFNAPGGHFLQTQFWDYESPLKWAGPNDSWTVHGLWPDHCDGTYDLFCASGREVQNITEILKSKGENRLLEWMGEYWKDNTGNDESFWEHEFNKHATCISTLEPQCIRNYQPGDDVVIFIKRTISLFQLLPTHLFLAAHGITPSTTKQYKLVDIQNVIVSTTGKKPTIGCDGPGKTFLHEMWYHYVTRGSVIDGLFLHTDADSTDSCADTVWYWPKGVATPSSTPTSSSTVSSSAPVSVVPPAIS
ncbi:ribonuclease T2-like protein [Irpex rosettiformis]|uniref:Ribonuclease T2-like protein n=1 Tax=Irpex rosettiformis TaxID=378272 RepID=A0ACB8TSK9_9APHY|nr:ribonuclease T2-like protein [Irpex rosettiformis]